jgi:hypothetical protein
MTHWRSPRNRPTRTHRQQTVGVRLATNRTQLISLENYDKTPKRWVIPWYVQVILYLFAAYGLYRVINFILYYIVTHYWGTYWKFL